MIETISGDTTTQTTESTASKLARGKQAAVIFATENGGTVSSRSIRPVFEKLGLLGGDERWIGFIFGDRKTFTKVGTEDATTDSKLRRKYIGVYAPINSEEN